LGYKEIKIKMDKEIEYLKAEVERHKNDEEYACQLVASMHAAAVGEVKGPKRGVVEDVKDLREGYVEMAQMLDDIVALSTPVPDTESSFVPRREIQRAKSLLLTDLHEQIIRNKSERVKQ
tara:strand:+ start:86 stop:445 length:360 start_codon:yes stop_codon:yes gene_type:complete